MFATLTRKVTLAALIFLTLTALLGIGTISSILAIRSAAIQLSSQTANEIRLTSRFSIDLNYALAEATSFARNHEVHDRQEALDALQSASNQAQAFNTLDQNLLNNQHLAALHHTIQQRRQDLLDHVSSQIWLLIAQPAAAGSSDADGSSVDVLDALRQQTEDLDTATDTMLAEDTTTSTDAIEQLTRQGSITIGVSFGLLMMLMLATLLLLRYDIIRPIKTLSQAATGIAQGELKQHIAITNHDEIGVLQQRFAQMVTQLAQMLEQRDHAVQASLEAKEAAETANAAKSDFIALVAHELKNPMTVLRGYTDLLLYDTALILSEEHYSYLKMVSNNLKTMTTLIADLTDTARIETGYLELHCSAIALAGAVDQVLHSISGQIRAKSLAVTVAIADTLPPLWADQTRLAQILTNLISNAEKYTPPCGEIRISAEWLSAASQHAPDSLRITVQDTGIGILPEEQQFVFQKFFRASDEQTRAQPGTGLGLTITRSLIELHGGSIWFESVARQGTAFHFTIPIASAEQIRQSKSQSNHVLQLTDTTGSAYNTAA